VSHLAKTYLGYSGGWRLGVYITDTRAARSDHYGLSSFRGFQASEYVDQTTATTAELLTAPGDVTQRLLTRLARGLNTSTVYSPSPFLRTVDRYESEASTVGVVAATTVDGGATLTGRVKALGFCRRSITDNSVSPSTSCRPTSARAATSSG
jgi:hypothetical protein